MDVQPRKKIELLSYIGYLKPMPIITIKGNIFDTECNLIAHGCNCKGGYGSGVAGQIAKLYPKARNSYIEKYQKEGWKLGDIQIVQVKENRWIANCATQYNYVPRDKVHADYDAIRKIMQELKDTCIKNKWSIAIPKIGCGLAGGDWKVVRKIINEIYNDMGITVYYL